MSIRGRRITARLILHLLFVLLPLLLIIGYAADGNARPEETTQLKASPGAVWFSGGNQGLQRIYLQEDHDDEELWIAFLSGDVSLDPHIYFSAFDELKIGEQTYRSGDSVNGLPPGVVYAAEGRDDQGNAIISFAMQIYQSRDVPSVYIDTNGQGMEEIHDDKTYRQNIVYEIFRADGEIDGTGSGSFGGRGNSTWEYNKKSYSLNLDNAASVLGMKAQRKWALLSNAEDFAYIRNKVALEMARKISIPYAPESRFVNLYIDGAYYGLYLMAQRLSAEGGSMRIDREGYLLEIDQRAEGPNVVRTATHTLQLYGPEDAPHPRLEEITEEINALEEQLYRRDVSGLDLNSWIKQAVMQEFFVNIDMEFASLFLYKNAGDPLIYAGPAWDFELTAGHTFSHEFPELSQQTLWLQSQGLVETSWLKEMDENAQFHKYLVYCYQKIFSPAMERMLKEDIPQLLEEIQSSAVMDAAHRRRDEYSVEERTALVGWLKRRKAFLDSYYGNESDYVQAEFIFGHGGAGQTRDEYYRFIYCLPRGTALGMLPEIDEGRTWTYVEGSTASSEDVIVQNVVLHDE